jgi:hypothetical protein
MQPENDPRYLAEVKPFVPDALTEAQVEEDMRYHTEILAMFSSKGWGHIEKKLTGTREDYVNRLVRFSGDDSLDVIYGLRSAVAMIDSIFSERTSAKASVESDKDLLSKMREGK